MSDQQKGYRIGAGVPLNQQYLRSEDIAAELSSIPPSKEQHSSPFAAPPPPDYNPHAPDIPQPSEQYQAYHPPPHYESEAHDQSAQYYGDEKKSGEHGQASIPLPTEQNHTHGGVGVSQVAGVLTPRKEEHVPLPDLAPYSSAESAQHYPPPPPLPTEQPHKHGGAGVSQVAGTVTPRTDSGPVPYFPPPPNAVSGQQYPPPPPIKLTEGGHSHAGDKYATAPTTFDEHDFAHDPPTKSGDGTTGIGQDYHATASGAIEYRPPLPPRPSQSPAIDPIHYTRDPQRLTAYLIPLPKPLLKNSLEAAIPDRFLIYTPPAPPIPKPAEGAIEPRLLKLQRKWQEEVRAAKTSTAKTASWKGVKSKATRGINKAVGLTTSANLDFLNRIPDGKASSSRQNSPDRRHADDGVHEDDSTHKTVGLKEMVLVYPASYDTTPEKVKVEFINTMLRSRSKAQRDAVIATGLLPVSAAIDILATPFWPFGGLLEVDGVWAYSSIRGAKTARSVTKRLTSSTKTGVAHHETEEQEMRGDKLQLNFQQDPRMEVLYRYLCSRCTSRNPHYFPSKGTATTESEVLEAIAWAPSQTGGEKNWEDEQWETSEVKDDLKMVMSKGAREWDNWCKQFAQDPEKALGN